MLGLTSRNENAAAADSEDALESLEATGLGWNKLLYPIFSTNITGAYLGP